MLELVCCGPLLNFDVLVVSCWILGCISVPACQCIQLHILQSVTLLISSVSGHERPWLVALLVSHVCESVIFLTAHGTLVFLRYLHGFQF